MLIINKLILFIYLNKLLPMKNVKQVLIITALTMVGYFLAMSVQQEDNNVFVAITLIISSLFIFHLSIRKIPFFKGYFINNLNILSNTFKKVESIDLPKDLLFDHIKEVVNKSSFTIFYKNSASGEIMATSSLGWKSWGENIYITIRKIDEVNSELTFYSTTILQIYDWGKNEENYKNLVKKRDESLIV